MAKRARVILGLALMGAMALGAPGCASNAVTPTTRRPVLTSSVRSWQDAAIHKGAWGQMRIFFRGESVGTENVLAATAVVEPGKAVHRAHRHAEEEYLVVQEGEGKWFLNGKHIPARKGDILYVEPWVYHGLTNTGDKPLVFTVIRLSAKGVALPPRPDDGKDEL
jgi:mannose-6-phosphate isomerase-like protein (cupin superfamily)